MLDRLFRLVTAGAAALVLLLVLVIVYQLWRQSHLSLGAFGWNFLATTTWDPVQEQYGALPYIFGTVVTATLALLLALPVSIGVAVFLVEIAPPWLSEPVSSIVELLAAIPSIVYGLWGIFVLCPFLQSTVEPWLQSHFGFIPLFQGTPYGVGMLAATLILAIMVVPIITSISRDVIRTIPVSQREAALAVGATRWEAIRIVLSDARLGIAGATILGLGRAVGETMAVTMVIGNTPQISSSLFSPAYTMASLLANEFAEATSDMYVSALIEISLVLLGVSLVLNTGARLLVWSVTRGYTVKES
jgi:phosphate transport system permease protein